MSFYKIIGFALTGMILLIVLKRMKDEYAHVLNALICSALAVCAVGILAPVVEFIKELGTATGSGTLFTLIFKSSGIALLTSFASDICRDSGENALSAKIELCGKCTILSLSLPIIKQVFDEVFGILG